MESFKCFICEKFFGLNASLRKHFRKKHPQLEQPSRKQRGRKKPIPTKDFNCSKCNKSFARKKTLELHELRVHLHSDDIVLLYFPNIEAFMSWKKEEENKALCRFVQRGASKEKYRYYVCHRSGSFVTRSRKVRNLKVQGSCKIGKTCASFINMKINSSGFITVRYCPVHTGHTAQLAHLTLRLEERQALARYIADGVPFNDILDNIQKTSSNENDSYLHYVSRKDLQNIARDFSLSRIKQFHSNDMGSVAAWVEHVRNAAIDKNLVRFVKFQGDESTGGLSKDDFMLVLIGEPQAVVLKKFCGPHRVVALDSIPGTNCYHFQLTTLMVLDEHGEGFPGAFCYSNKVDEASMTVFLNICRDAIGSVDGAILMTGDTEVYYNAWRNVMGPLAHRLLCEWHVDQAWRKNISKIKGETFVKAQVYKTLYALLEIRDINDFQFHLAKFLEKINSDIRTSDFGAYFQREYANRCHLWAYCHRLGFKVHRNMHLMALHRAIKRVHLQGRKVQRLDESIHGLLKLMRAKMRDRLLKLHKGKWTRHLHGIRRRHQISKIMHGSCHEISNNSFCVEGCDGESYSVTKADDLPHCENLCPLMCVECSICVHSFTCNCSDGGLRNTICKHIHFVAQTFCDRRITSSSQMENLELENVELEDIVAAEDQAASGDKETQAILTSCGSHSNAERK